VQCCRWISSLSGYGWAPKNYPFGTKIKIPGVGVVAVHDRGGAIVNAGQRNQSHDRWTSGWVMVDARSPDRSSLGRRTVEVTCMASILPFRKIFIWKVILRQKR